MHERHTDSEFYFNVVRLKKKENSKALTSKDSVRIPQSPTWREEDPHLLLFEALKGSHVSYFFLEEKKEVFSTFEEADKQKPAYLGSTTAKFAFSLVINFCDPFSMKLCFRSS